MTKKKETNKIEILLEPIVVKKIKVTIKGKTPLLMDRFPESAQNSILAKQTGLSKSNKKKVRDTAEETKDAVHMTASGKVGFPIQGFKAGMMECTSFVGDKFFSKKLVAGSVKIVNGEDGLIPLKYKKQTVLRHNISHNIKFSPQFHDWSCELEILYDSNNISAQDILTLINYAGFYVGVGSWRPKCRDKGSGEFGTYEVKT